MIHQMKAFEGSPVLAIEFIKDGKLLITSSQNGEIKIWGSEPFDWDSK